jgi:hypothetical protein
MGHAPSSTAKGVGLSAKRGLRGFQRNLQGFSIHTFPLARLGQGCSPFGTTRDKKLEHLQATTKVNIQLAICTEKINFFFFFLAS